MIISLETGLLNVFIEPQFANLCNEPLYTVQAAEIAPILAMRPKSFTESRFVPGDPLFQFNSFVYSWNLEHVLKPSEIRNIEMLTSDFNPEPLAYCFEVEQLEDDVFELAANDGDCVGTLRVGYFLPSKLPTMKSALNQKSEEFKVYPLYRQLSDHEQSTIWIS